MKSPHNVVVFGATSAIAQAVARRLVEHGCNLFAVGRNPEKLNAVVDDLRVRRGPNQLVAGRHADLDRVEEHAALFDASVHALGGVDTVIIAHGSLPDQLECEVSIPLMLAQIHTNAISAVALAAAAAQRLQAGGGGQIVAIGSVAGDRGRQSNYVYGAAKGMLALFLQGLRNSLDARGVHVLTVKPGFVDTPMTAGFTKKGFLWATPDRVASDIVRAMFRRKDVIYTPGFWRWIMLCINHVPERIFKRMRL